MEGGFLNLKKNAGKAAPERHGKIAIDIVSTADSFEIRVSDNGSGIPASIRNTLFDPFVSSGKSNGTGLGRAIVSKVVHDHGGVVSVERTSEAGTVFLIKIPRTQPEFVEIPQKVTT